MGLFDLVFWVSLPTYAEVELMGPSLSLIIAFVLKSILSAVSIATPGFHFVLFPFSWNISIHPFTFSLCVFPCKVNFV